MAAGLQGVRKLHKVPWKTDISDLHRALFGRFRDTRIVHVAIDLVGNPQLNCVPHRSRFFTDSHTFIIERTGQSEYVQWQSYIHEYSLRRNLIPDIHVFLSSVNAILNGKIWDATYLRHWEHVAGPEANSRHQFYKGCSLGNGMRISCASFCSAKTASRMLGVASKTETKLIAAIARGTRQNSPYGFEYQDGECEPLFDHRHMLQYVRDVRHKLAYKQVQ
jgi:hypothetical protein